MLIVSKGQALNHAKVKIMPKKIDGTGLSRQLYLNRAPAKYGHDTVKRDGSEHSINVKNGFKAQLKRTIGSEIQLGLRLMVYT